MKLLASKKSSNEIKFKNLHNEKERLKVVILGIYAEGELFTINFCIPYPPSENNENKFLKLCKDLSDDYIYTYDG